MTSQKLRQAIKLEEEISQLTQDINHVFNYSYTGDAYKSEQERLAFLRRVKNVLDREELEKINEIMVSALTKTRDAKMKEFKEL